MAKVLWAAFVAMAAFFVLADSLKCNQCSVGILGICLSTSEQTCTGTEDRCYSGKAEFNITGALNFETRGCMVNTSCVSTTGTVLGAGYTVTRTCCSTDLCNGATAPQLSTTTTLAAALLVLAWAKGMF
ncbi:sperm acrosome membrane-associated protein 4-like [Engraulis encrasicolus]|uniref:sperm acrosome membrane-associated protein 4-like n=1 Tax=Engraulis encrasicolus TaxID=184585 RepID=UPI002FCEFE2F